MSNSRDLLKEAIADAKSVKEAAIANAKAALEEAFTPYLQEKFAAKLEEMDREEERMKEAEMTDENYGEDDKMEERLGTLNDPDETGVGNAFSSAPKGNLEEKDLDELNLEELLAELGEEIETEGMEEKTEESLTEAEEEETEEEESEKEVEGEDEEIDLEDMSEEDLKALIEDVIADMVAAGELEAGENFEEESDEEEIDIDDEDEEEEMVAERKHYGKPRKSTAKEKDELLKEEKINENITRALEFVRDNAPEVMDVLLKIQDTVGINPGTALALAAATAGVAIPSMIGLDLKRGEEGKSKILNISKKVGDGAQKLLSMLKGAGNTNEAEVEEMESKIEELASTLSEVKLLNAKLLYTNKIFRAKNLTENQKVKVLEAFDKAASVKDAKLIYETLTAIKETKTSVTESMRGMASKAVGIAPEKKPILEVNNQFARWQILAGIKKNN
jgi:hypothetical protein